METNVRDYDAIIQHMTKINSWMLEYVLKQPDPDSSTANVRPVLRADYERFTKDRTLPTHDSMLSQCPALGWDTR
jgi:hypothetical protein